MSHRIGPPTPTNHGANHLPTDTNLGGLPRPVHRPWEEVYPVLNAERQAELLHLAQQQGFLLADQIPPLTIDSVRTKLHDTFHRTLVPLPLLTVPHDFTASEALQREAVQRALHTPDYLLIVGPPGTGKKRIASDLIQHVVQAGQRVLLLSANTPALDRLLLTLVNLPEVKLTRLVGPHEHMTALPASILALTRAEQERQLRQHLADKANQELTTAEQALRSAQTAEQAWMELAKAIAEQDDLTHSHTLTEQQQSALDEEIERDAQTTSEPVPYFVQRLRGVANSHDKKLAALATDSATLAQERSALEAAKAIADKEVQELRQKAEGLAHGGVLSLGYWKAKMDKSLPTRLTESEGKLGIIQAKIDDVAQREAVVAATRQQYEDDYRAERTKLLNDERQRRLATLAAQQTEREQQRATLARHIESACQTLTDVGVAVPTSLSVEGCHTGIQQATQQLTQSHQRLNAAREWLGMLHAAGEAIVAQSRSQVNVVAGPLEAASDPTLADSHFDWLILDHAHEVAESVFVAVARKAKHWLLLGEPPPDTVTERHPSRSHRSDFFNRLCYALQPSLWYNDHDRLVCELYPVRGADRRRLECEPVADSPEIELRLINLPNGEPQLAEVAFPANYEPAAARAYLARELQEVTAQPVSRIATWQESADTITVRFAQPSQPTLAELGNGIQEELDGLGTTALHFAKSDGWTRSNAEEWANEHLTKHDLGRCVSLYRPWRACPGLAHWLNAAIGTTYEVPPQGDPEPHVEFLAVPERERRSRDATGRTHRVGGAGYEIDLSDPRQRASLPADLLVGLPETGWVNLHEAQAIVRHLEIAPNTSSTAVTSPIAAQVVLLRTLLKQSPRLRSVAIFGVEEADRFECEQLIISLTRSHPARAVPFGDSPAVMSKLLSRVRRYVLFVGDPGTLARRLQWDRAVDHLGAGEAARERRWIAALADCPRVNTHRSRTHAESVPV